MYRKQLYLTKLQQHRWPVILYYCYFKAVLPTLPGFSGGASGKEPAYQCRRHGFHPWVGEIPWRRAWLPTLVFLLGELYGQRPWWATVQGGSQRVRHDLATNTHTIIFKIDNQQGKNSSTRNSTQYSVITYMGRESEIHIHTYTYVYV